MENFTKDTTIRSHKSKKKRPEVGFEPTTTYTQSTYSTTELSGQGLVKFKIMKMLQESMKIRIDFKWTNRSKRQPKCNSEAMGPSQEISNGSSIPSLMGAAALSGKAEARRIPTS